LPGRQAAADQRAGACGDTATGQMRGPGLAPMRSGKNPAADARRRLGYGPASVPTASRLWRGCAGTWPMLPALSGRDLVIAAGIPAIAGAPVLEEDARAGQNQARPPMYEMGGLARRRRARSGQSPGFAGVARPAGARHPCEGPVSRLLPRSQGRPQVVPVSNGESIFTASANTAQEPEANYFWFLQYPHGIHRKNAVIRL
jgi:hypothetical protein